MHVDFLPKSARPRIILRHLTLLAVALSTSAWVLVATAATEPSAPLVITSDHADGVYALGEPIHWRVAVNEGSATPTNGASYTIKQGGLTLLAEGKLLLTNAFEDVKAALTQPGTLLLEVKATNPDGKPTRALAGAVVAPERIPVASSRPEDFDAFWQAKLEELSQVAPNPQLASGESGKPEVRYWQMTLDNIRGTHIRGQLARPNSGEKFPAMLIVQWAGVYPLQKSWVTDPATAGWLVLNINAHDLPIDESAEFYQQQSQGPLKNYPSLGNDDRDRSYFLRMYLSCYRAAQYLVERPDWDGKTLLVTGNSQGGLQTLMLAGFHPRVTAAIAGVPDGPQAGRSPGWPSWYWNTQDKDPAQVRTTARYYDVVNFASHIKCPVLAGVGLIDETCPPAGILAAMNQVPGPKEIVLLTKGDHQGTHNSHQAFNNRSAAWRAALLEGKPAPASASVAQATPSALESSPDGWVDLLPTEDLQGWYRVPVPPSGSLGRAQWHVDADHKVLICDGDGGHDMLLFDRELGDAIFHFEFCYTKVEGKTGYNSGAYVRNSKDGAIWHQAQFGDAKDGYLFGQTSAAEGKKKSFNLSKQVKDGRVKPTGEWNTMEVTARGSTLSLWVNGAVTCRFDECGLPQGRVGLEGEGYRIEFRNLRIKELR
jgi:cephalosporin-C deacetylase